MKLIDADALLHVLQSYDTGVKRLPGIDRAIFHVKDAPTIDAAPVAYARWVNSNPFDEWETFRCSNCGAVDNCFGTNPYCSNCGAKMDAEEEWP